MIIIHQGAFGMAVADALALRVNVTCLLSLDEALRHDWQGTSPNEFVVLALGALHPRRISRLTETLWTCGLPHSVAVLSDHLLTCGPLVLPPNGPCYSCSMKRALSMVENPRTSNLDLNLQLYLERSPTLELRGYLPTLVQMAALKLTRHASLDASLSSRVSAVSLNNNSSIESKVIALHGCRCRGERLQTPDERWLRDLELDVEEVLRA